MGGNEAGKNAGAVATGVVFPTGLAAAVCGGTNSFFPADAAGTKSVADFENAVKGFEVTDRGLLDGTTPAESEEAAKARETGAGPGRGGWWAPASPPGVPACANLQSAP